MRLRAKFYISITIIFVILAIGISLTNIHWVNKDIFKEADHRVKVYIRAAWTIHNNKIESIVSILETLAQDNEIKNFMSLFIFLFTFSPNSWLA